MNINKALYLMGRYAICPECGNDKIGASTGGMVVKSESFIRTCACGFSIEVEADGLSNELEHEKSPIAENTVVDNYKEIKNYIHNELRITKQDIRDAILITVKEEVEKVLNDESYIETLITHQIKEVLSRNYQTPTWQRLFNLDTEIYNAVCDEVSKMVKEKVELKFKV